MIGLGEDGPTHQPVEHLASLRLSPTFRCSGPATPSRPPRPGIARSEPETTPSVLCLSRQALPAFRDANDNVNRVARGAYVVVEPDDGRDVTLIATGFEVSIALDAAKLLAADNIRAAVVSAPCFDLFVSSRPNIAPRFSEPLPGSASRPRSKATGRVGSAIAAHSSV